MNFIVIGEPTLLVKCYESVPFGQFSSKPPWVGVNANENVIGNLPLVSGELADAAAQQLSLDSLAKILLDNHIAFDFLLAE